MPHLLKAADWIVSERQATLQRELDGTPVPEYGLLPAGQLEDNEDFEYWFAVNAYAYQGLRAAAEAVSVLDADAGARLSREAGAYRADIRRAVLHAMSIAPVVPLGIGTFVPSIPPRTSLHGRDSAGYETPFMGRMRWSIAGCLTPMSPLPRGSFRTMKTISSWPRTPFQCQTMTGSVEADSRCSPTWSILLSVT